MSSEFPYHLVEIESELFNCKFYFRAPVPRNLSDVKLIPPYEQVVLDNAFTKIDQWSINLLRDAVLEAGDTYKKTQFNLRGCTSDMSLGFLPCARFIVAALGMLTVGHAAGGVSLLLNSGVLALTQVSIARC
jgi:E3 ubiquitin-protein ligase HERC2